MATTKMNEERPDDLPGHPNADREALEALAIRGYRSGELTHHQASRLLGMSRFEFESFLKDRKIYDHAYGPEDFEEDLRTLQELERKGPLR
jgi:predicted HTH domain antitoxin